MCVAHRDVCSSLVGGSTPGCGRSNSGSIPGILPNIVLKIKPPSTGPWVKSSWKKNEIKVISESGFSVWIILRSMALWCASYCGVRLHGVHHTVESGFTVCIILRSQASQCASYCGIRLHGVHHTAEYGSVVCILLGVRLHGVHYTVESGFMVCIILQSQASQCAQHCIVRLQGVHHTAESDSVVCFIPQSQEN